MTQWTKLQYEELSQKVAEKFSIAKYMHWAFPNGSGNYGWLHNDWHTLMELCVKHGVYAYHDEYVNKEFDGTYKLAIAEITDEFILVNVEHKDKQFLAEYADHNNDPSLAERVARMLALMEVANSNELAGKDNEV